ncbi:MAG: hypothetical protein GX900_03155 [Clostridiaceae bacterium]|nr:hypothetical protein [Clostridiaceae bacterium]
MERLAAPERRRNSGGYIGFHMPGHRGGHDFPPELRTALSALDITEISASDDLNAPGPALRAAAHLAAEAWQTERSYFITTGSSTTIKVMLALAPGPDGRLFCSRAVHQSVIHAAALLNIRPVFLPDDLNLETTTALLSAHHDESGRSAFLITSPDYYGRVVDLRGIASLAERERIPLLIDAAHGAHFNFAPDLAPPPATASGADLIVHSLHKTLPALTPASLLHVASNSLFAADFDDEKIYHYLRIFQTSSPSLMVAASMDYARYYVSNHGGAAIARVHEELLELNRSLHDYGYIPEGPLPRSAYPSGLAERDPIRLVLDCSCLGGGFAMAHYLESKGIYCELAEPRRIVFLPSLGQPAEDFRALGKALREYAEQFQRKGCNGDSKNANGGDGKNGNCYGDSGSSNDNGNDGVETDIPYLSRRDIDEIDQIYVSMREMPADCEGRAEPHLMLNLAAATALPLSQAVNRRLATPLIIRPPGLACRWPGEHINADELPALTELHRFFVQIDGITSGSARVLL